MRANNIYKKIVDKTFRNFFLPTVISSLALSIISLTDMIIAGQLIGEKALASISLVYPANLMIYIVSALFGMGTAICLSIYLGEGNKEKCNQIISISIILALFVSIIISVIGVIFADNILYVLGAKNIEIREAAKQYWIPFLAGFVPMTLSPVFITFLRNDSKPREAMTIVLSCGVVNLSLDLVLAGILDLGLIGISVASVVAETISFIVAVVILFKNGSFKFVIVKIDLKIVKEMITPALPLVSIFTAQVILTAFINNILMECSGAKGVAVYAILKYLIGFIYALYDGVTGALQPMLGIYVGENEKDNIKYSAKIAFKYISIIGIGLIIILELFAPFICRIFGATDELLVLSANALRIQAVFCYTAGFIALANAFFRCTNKAGISLTISLLNNLILDIPIILLLKKIMNNSLYCVFLGLVIVDIVTIIILFGIVYVKVKLNKGEGVLLLENKPMEGKLLYKNAFEVSNESVKNLLLNVEQVCEENDINPKTAYYINLCIEEVVANVAGRADVKKDDTYVDVIIRMNEDNRYMLRIRDNLNLFDPTKSSKDNIAASADELGDMLGIEIVKKVAKEYYYKRNIGMNDFRVVL